MKYFLLFSVFFFFTTLVQARDRSTIVINALALDGDTLQVGHDVFRLWGVDAPELQQECVKNYQQYPCGAMAKKVLQEVVMHGDLKCKMMPAKIAAHAAKCTIDGHDVGNFMVLSGWALDSSGESYYALSQEQAQEKHSGIWRGQFSDPAKWRAGDHFLAQPPSPIP